MSVTLYRKYRPQTWSDIAGQKHIKDTLAYEIASGQIAHAYLLAGPRGVGKTTIARIFAKAINCTNRKEDSGEPCNECDACRAVSEGGSLDIIEIDAASHTGVDAVRENVIENARFSPARLKNKVFIIDEVHMLSNSAFNALLKTLEEPPANVIFLLATTELHKIPATVISRCQRFDFRKISLTDIVGRLTELCRREKIKIDEDVLLTVARQAEGCLRDAEGLLGKVMAFSNGKKVTRAEALAVLPRSDWESAARLIEALIGRNTTEALSVVSKTLESGADIDIFMTEIVELLRQTMLAKLSSGAGLDVGLEDGRKDRVIGWAKSVELGFLVRALETMTGKQRELKGSQPVQLPLELAVVKICEASQLNNSTTTVLPTGQGRQTSVKEPVVSRPQTNKVVESVNSTDEAVAGVVEAIDQAGVEPSVVLNETEQEITTTIELNNEPIAREVRPAKENKTADFVGASLEPCASVEEVKAVWQTFMQNSAKVSQSLKFMLGAVTPVGVSGQVIKIGSTFLMYRDKINEQKTSQILEDTLSDILGKKVLVEGVMLEKSEELAHTEATSDSEMSVNPAEKVAQSVENQVTEPAPAGGASAIADAFGGRVVG